MTWRFPTLQAINLEGTVFDLPGAFAGDPSVVIVAFRRRQQSDVDSWLPWLGELRERLPGLEVYELPALERRWLPARSFIDGGMRAGIPDPDMRQRTLTAYTDIVALTRALRIDSTSAIALFVVSREGIVVWSGRADYDPDAAAILERAATAARNDKERSLRAAALKLRDAWGMAANGYQPRVQAAEFCPDCLVEVGAENGGESVSCRQSVAVFHEPNGGQIAVQPAKAPVDRFDGWRVITHLIRLRVDPYIGLLFARTHSNPSFEGYRVRR